MKFAPLIYKKPFAERQQSVEGHQAYVLTWLKMVELLKYALALEKYDAAAYAIVYGLLVAKLKNGKKAGKKGRKARLLRPRPG